MIAELFQPMHLLLILVIALLLFGPGKLPQIAANMGKSIREFKSALNGTEPNGSERDRENGKKKTPEDGGQGSES